MEIMYKTTAISTGGREGKVEVLNSPLQFDLAFPPELGGSGKEGANPEQLFAAGYAACFGSAVQHVVRLQKIVLSSVSITAEVGIGRDKSGGFALEVTLILKVSGIDQVSADALIQEAHQVCPYSKATRGNIKVSLIAVVE